MSIPEVSDAAVTANHLKIPEFNFVFYLVEDFRASGFAQVRLHPLSQTLNVTNMECRLNLQTLNVGVHSVIS